MTNNQYNRRFYNGNDNNIKIVQINLQNSKAATSECIKYMNSKNIDIALITEPYTFKNDVRGFPINWRKVRVRHKQEQQLL